MTNKPSGRFQSHTQNFVVSALTISALALLTFLSSAQLFSASAVSPNAVTSENTSTLRAKQSISTYKWNLEDQNLPLIGLPDRLGAGVDLSIAYSMDQFQFPLFQSLYYNDQAGKYILMVMSEHGGTKLIDLTRTPGQTATEFTSTSNLRLAEKGDSKLITTSDGTVYTFARSVDGELRCSRIDDRAGLVINLKYNSGASLARIADSSGRTVSFNYTNLYVSSITQTWGPGSQRKKTWAIDTDANNAHTDTLAVSVAPVNFAHARPALASPAIAKRIPTNAISPKYTDAMAHSDSSLANIFGGAGATAAANGFEPAGLGNQYPLYRGDLIGDDGVVRRGHLSFAMHLYGSADGTGAMSLYVPAGFTRHSNEPSPTDAAVTFFYPRLGNLTNVTLAVFHVANFKLEVEGERVKIGDIGGRGGSVASYKHSHIEFYRGDTGLPCSSARPQLRIDPGTIFGPPPTAARH